MLISIEIATTKKIIFKKKHIFLVEVISRRRTEESNWERKTLFFWNRLDNGHTIINQVVYMMNILNGATETYKQRARLRRRNEKKNNWNRKQQSTKKITYWDLSKRAPSNKIIQLSINLVEEWVGSINNNRNRQNKTKKNVPITFLSTRANKSVVVFEWSVEIDRVLSMMTVKRKTKSNMSHRLNIH